ncbi:hypothetical protein LCGC14_0960710 [marine sediment metagenome]|uniref:Twin-arginine translocation signal domain-containing protein n=1 Tax=marine sediment metagenome TaxID=412755 RepID=A0A0F9NEH4_9ZZZZ
MLKSTRRQFLRGTAGVAGAAVVPALPVSSETPPELVPEEIWIQCCATDERGTFAVNLADVESGKIFKKCP